MTWRCRLYFEQYQRLCIFANLVGFDIVSTMPLGIFLFYFIIIIPSAIIHEYSHAWVADMLGDSTARDQGRLTLNPVVHIDLFGTILLPLMLLVASGGGFLFAYARPVPYNPLYLRNQKWGPALVGIAGPASNIFLALVFSFLLRFISLEGSFAMFLSLIVMANVALALFNLLPIPPLDGSKLLYALFPQNLALQMALERYGILFLLFVILFGGRWLAGLIYWVAKIFLPG